MGLKLYAVDNMLYTEKGLFYYSYSRSDAHHIYKNPTFYELGSNYFIVLTSDEFEVIQKITDNKYQSLTVESIRKLKPLLEEVEKYG